jgi:hypothetical protein
MITTPISRIMTMLEPEEQYSPGLLQKSRASF